ncbi:MAG: MoaD/ThiS family protein [Phycisphaeraceae bacterium]|nr:MoaD/ThiS family protein [Phycisphaeraceae bacterium]
MRHDILLFGPAATTAGAPSVAVNAPPGSTCDTLRAALAEQHGAIAAIARSGRLAVNGAYVDGSTVINESDELALVALVSGG